MRLNLDDLTLLHLERVVQGNVCLGAEPGEIAELDDRFVGANALAGVLHPLQDVRVGVLGGHLERAADVVGRQLAHVRGRKLGQVHADAAGDEHLADSRFRAGLSHQPEERAVVGP